MQPSRLISLLLLACLAGCGKPPAPPAAGGGAVQSVVALAEEQPLEERLFLVGDLRAEERIDIRSEIDGRITRIGFEEGERIEAGRVLFLIDDDKLAAEVAEARARHQLAEQEFERGKRLVERKTISEQQFDRFRTSLDESRAALALASERRNDASIIAPFGGRAGERLVSLGQFVDRGELLATLTQTDPLELAFNVPERYLGQVAVGETVEVTTAAFGEERFPAAIDFISPAVDTDSRTVLVKGHVDNPGDRLKPGMFARLELTFRARERAVVVPEQAVSYRGNDAQLVVMDAGGNAEFRTVTIGLRLAGLAEVLEGVAAGERVVVEGFQKLQPGAPISVAPESSRYGVEPELAQTGR